MKELFSILIRNEYFKSSNQQDAGEGLFSILQSIKEKGITERNFIDPFGFCSFSWRENKTCLNCLEVEELAITEGNILMVQAPEMGNFDMKQAVISK